MKLRNLAIFAIALSLPLAACGGGDDAAETDGTMTADSPAVVAPMPAPAPMPGDSAAMGTDTMGGMSHDTMGGMSHDTMADTTKM